MRKPPGIAPSILSANFTELGRDIGVVTEAGADWIHVDVMDGHFVPNLSIGPAHIGAIRTITDVPTDVHLMVSNPEYQMQWYLDAGADSITFHIEAMPGPGAVGLVDFIRKAGVRAGVAISPDTDLAELDIIIRCADLLLVMGVHPGFSGQSFIPETTGRVRELRQMCTDAGVSPIIEVDGGVDVHTAPLLAEAGADILVAGSAVFSTEDPVASMRAIRDACL